MTSSSDWQVRPPLLQGHDERVDGGHAMSPGRAYRLWRLAGLQVPRKEAVSVWPRRDRGRRQGGSPNSPAPPRRALKPAAPTTSAFATPGARRTIADHPGVTTATAMVRTALL